MDCTDSASDLIYEAELTKILSVVHTLVKSQNETRQNRPVTKRFTHVLDDWTSKSGVETSKKRTPLLSARH